MSDRPEDVRGAPEATAATRLPFEDALRRILAALPSPAAASAAPCPLAEAAGRVLAEDVVAGAALPPWANSGMDGYAVRRGDVLGATGDAPRSLRVTGSIAAGAPPEPAVAPGTAVAIMTGAPVPAGAEAVVRVEDVTRDGDTIRVHDDRDARSATGNVRPAGEDVAVGDRVLTAGTRLTPAALGLLAALGRPEVRVHRRPVVVVAASGDELVDVRDFGGAHDAWRIVSSSTVALPPLIRGAGADVHVLPLLPDDPAVIRAALAGALAERAPDLLVTTGGVSVGAHDHIRDVLRDLGGRLDFWRARIRPGGPLGFGRIGEVPWLGLPGNPVSTLVTATLFLVPALRRLGGETRCVPVPVPVVLDEPLTARAPLAHFLRVTLHAGPDGRLHARSAGAQGSNLVGTMARADALVRVDGPGTADAGTVASAYPLGETALAGEPA